MEVATLEGLDGAARSCLAVKAGKGGYCRCGRHGPPGTGHDFKTLCTDAGLKIRIGRTDIGKDASHMSRSLPPPLDLSPIDEELSFLDGPLYDAQMLRESLGAAGGGAAAGLLFGIVTTQVKKTQMVKDAAGKEVPVLDDKNEPVKVPWFDTPLKQGLLSLGIGLLGGRALWFTQQDMSKGIVGAMGSNLATIIVGAVMAKMNEKESGATDGLGYTPEDEMALSDGLLPEERALVEDVSVDERRPMLTGFADVDVVERKPGIGAWIGM